MRGNDQDRAEVIGTVTGCDLLSLYESPDPEAAVLTELPAKGEILVDLDHSTASYYKICNAAGIEGFCKRQFVSIHS